MNFIYDLANGNGSEAARLYQIGFSDRRKPSYPNFLAVYLFFSDTGKIKILKSKNLDTATDSINTSDKKNTKFIILRLTL